MIKIGITGGIGSGKSLVCSILEHLDFPVFYSDQEARTLMDNDPGIRLALTQLVGEEVYHSGYLDRPGLAKKIFSDTALINKVNEVVHPVVRSAFQKWAEKQTSKLVFNEAAILFETGAYRLFDATILVTAPEELRIQRVMKRDALTESEVKNRMNNQWSDAQKIPLATYIIQNDEKQGLIDQIEKIIESF